MGSPIYTGQMSSWYWKSPLYLGLLALLDIGGAFFFLWSSLPGLFFFSYFFLLIYVLVE